ncbi:uncharacterized protein LOC105903019 isoform X3 [Clupea harengus]|uniref:RING-type E3 ubiquitin transferase n=1 Tax=Clupea harengus TaxID=7950 RepID=A0A6P8FD66_CLUHA|nr:uncharacterized protein LOC105903019 isoform X3 [Clupea harengus]
MDKDTPMELDATPASNGSPLLQQGLWQSATYQQQATEDVEMSDDGNTDSLAGTSDQQVSTTGTLLAAGSSSVLVDRTATQAQNHSDEPKNATYPEGIPTYATAITEQPLKDTSAPNTSQHLGHQPIGDTSAPYTSQHLGHQPSGDTSAPYTSQHLGHQPIGDTSAPYTSHHLGHQYSGDTSAPYTSQHLGHQPIGDTSAPYTSQHLGHQPSGDTSAPYTSQHLGHQPSGDTGGQTQMQQFQAPGPAGNLMGFPGGWRDGAKGPTSQQKLSRLRSQDPDETKPSEDEMLSKPQDVAAVIVEIEWEVKEQPPKWERMVKKALQSFFNKDLKEIEQSIEVSDLYILDAPFLAKIIISPSSACEMLLNMKSAPLNFKDRDEKATVHFRTTVPVDEPPVSAPIHKYGSSVQKTQEIPMTVSAVVDVRKFEIQLEKKLLCIFEQHKTGSHTLTVNGTFEEVEEFYKEFNQVIGQPVTRNTNTVFKHTNPNQMETSREPMRVPLFQYWYLNQMQRKEIEHIQDKHGVAIKADVCVTVEETSGATSDSCTVATNEFIDLFTKFASNIVTVPVPSAALELVQRLDTKLMLTASAQSCILLGPPDHVAAAERLLNQPANKDDPRSERPEVHWDKDRNKNPHGESRWNRPKAIEMNIKDPLSSNGLCISETHWELMKNAFKKQIKDLKKKFGVDFKENSTHGNVTVSAQSTGIQIVNLEVNALRALMSLYQKIVTTTMSCPLQNISDTQTKMVKEHLSDIRKQNPSLAVVEISATGGAWMMIGLPDHLRFAVKEIEKKLGGPVFDRKHKDMLGYEQDADFLRPYGNESAKGYEPRAAASGSSVDGAKGYEGWAAASGSSVDGATSSSVYGENQKPGGAGRKETKEYEKCKWEKGNGSTGGPNDDHRAPPGGKDGGGEEDKCPICIDEFNNEVKLSCGHSFCKDCLRQSVESMGATCPVCKDVFGKVEGDQPDGTMKNRIDRSSVPGYGRCDTIVIDYNIPSGNQSSRHPKPGRPFQGAHRTAYLPDNKEGREILALLRRAFDQRLIFTVGTSRTSGQDDCVTWNDIHHKTSQYGGQQSFGYPDDGYMKRVREELKAKGIE